MTLAARRSVITFDFNDDAMKMHLVDIFIDRKKSLLYKINVFQQNIFSYRVSLLNVTPSAMPSHTWYPLLRYFIHHQASHK